jgi:phosphatidylethanolamine/phosphatidyl-N-methylethanolamine N-methyltransferase
MTNQWNQFIYRAWAPVYDSTVNQIFMPGRRRAMDLLALQPDEKVLIVGVGTGADLPLLPENVEATGIDLSPDMLEKAQRKVSGCRGRVTLIQGDAQNLLVEQESFDAAILNLILSVVPDGHTCMQSALRAVKRGGRLVVFDKFQPDHEAVSPIRKVMNVFSTLFGTDITRRFGDLMCGCPCVVTHDEASLLGGMYRVLLLTRI